MLKVDSQMETKSPIKRLIKVSVPAETVKGYLDSSFVRVQKTAQLKGFRKGKVPLSMIKQYYLYDVKSDALKRVLNESLWKAVEDHKLEPVGSPQVEEIVGGDLDDAKPLSYVLHVEIFPEISLKDLKQIKVKKHKAEVTDADIEGTITNIRENRAVVGSHEDDAEALKPVSVGDFIEISFKGTVEGKTDDKLTGNNQVFKLGSKRFMDEFEGAIAGMKKGETKKVSVPFPADFPDSLVAGKAVDFEITLNERKKVTLPEIDEEFCKPFGVETVEALKEKIRTTIEDEKTREATTLTKESLIKGMLKAHSFEIPSAMKQAELEYLMKDFVDHYKRQKFTDKMIEAELNKFQAELEQRAEDRVKAYLLFDKVAKDHSIDATEELLNAEFDKMGQSYGMDGAVVRKYYEGNQDGLNRLKHKLKEDRVVDFLMEKVTVEL